MARQPISLRVLRLLSLLTLPWLVQGCARAEDDGVARWRPIAQRTCDHPDQALHVIWKNTYSGGLLELARAYREQLDRKPGDEKRLASFANAALSAERYEADRHRAGLAGKLVYRAAGPIEHLINPEQYHTPYDLQHQKFPKTEVAELWVAQARFEQRFGFQPRLAEKYLQHALELDPRLNVARFWLAEAMIDANGQPNFLKRAPETLRELDLAEKAEPATYIAALPIRWIIALDGGDIEAARRYLREYLQKWPGAVNSKELREELAMEDARAAQKRK